MRIQVLSDLHIKFDPVEEIETDRDLLILAGDIGEGKSAKWFIESQTKHSPVVIVLGNHEFHNNHWDKTIEYWKNLNIEGLHVLERDTVEIDGLNILGCTLWSDMGNRDPLTMAFSKAELNDYKLIWYGPQLLSPEKSVEIHLKSVEWLEHNLSKIGGRKIVVTHFLPTAKSLHPRYHDIKFRKYYYSELDWLIEKTQPELWIHGHIHNSMDYSIGTTRIVCNPKGYEHEEPNPLFNPNKIIEI